jgi:hypothetical protein
MPRDSLAVSDLVGILRIIRWDQHDDSVVVFIRRERFGLWPTSWTEEYHWPPSGRTWLRLNNPTPPD